MGNSSSGDEDEGASRSKSTPPPMSSTGNSDDSLRKFKTVSLLISVRGAQHGMRIRVGGEYR